LATSTADFEGDQTGAVSAGLNLFSITFFLRRHMNAEPQTIASMHHGFGLGLRPVHYPDFLAAKQPVDWLEIVTDNFLVEGGKPLLMLQTLRRDYPMVMHGVAMSIGSAAGVDTAYLQQVKQLADRIEPLWVSDHLCWTGCDNHPLHDLNPLPYTDEVARHVITQIRRAQDVLKRRLVVENVSSYISFEHSTASEWQFLSHVAQEADCLLLVDVNNVYVSSVNHGFDAETYLRALPAQRVQQIHLAGHSNNAGQLIDTHDHPVALEVWALYAQACSLFGTVPTMVERDAEIPALPELLDEVAQARAVAARAKKTPASLQPVLWPVGQREDEANLHSVQKTLTHYVLQEADAPSQAALSLLANQQTSRHRLSIYHHAYRARLCEVLADTYAKTYLFMGSDTFDTHAAQFVQAHPPTSRSLNRYGAQLLEFLANLYPHNVELQELAQLDWDLRTCFDSADHAALNVQTAQQDAQHRWLDQPYVLHPSCVLRHSHTNATQLWKAIDADLEVPTAVTAAQARLLMVWRKELRPHFQIIPIPAEALIQSLAQGRSFNAACSALEASDQPPPPQDLSLWLRGWLEDGLFSAPSRIGATTSTTHSLFGEMT
jgi:uncharacterized protein (UPF0276 family)